jgi:1-acyl-sn-glycerol-3-phosphate acyltransferase
VTAWRGATPFARRLFRFWFRLELSGGSLPPGPVVVAANHYSHLDPVVVGIAVRRPVRFLAVDELFGRSRFFDGLTTWLGAIPMTRTKIPLGPMRTALAELASGGSVGLFPEGVRVWHWGEQRPKRGAAWLARRAGVPLVPVAIQGSDVAMGRGTGRILRSPMRAEVGAALDPERFAGEPDPVGALTEAWRSEVDRMLGAG